MHIVRLLFINVVSSILHNMIRIFLKACSCRILVWFIASICYLLIAVLILVVRLRRFVSLIVFDPVLELWHLWLIFLPSTLIRMYDEFFVLVVSEAEACFGRICHLCDRFELAGHFHERLLIPVNRPSLCDLIFYPLRSMCCCFFISQLFFHHIWFWFPSACCNFENNEYGHRCSSDGLTVLVVWFLAFPPLWSLVPKSQWNKNIVRSRSGVALWRHPEIGQIGRSYVF